MYSLNENIKFPKHWYPIAEFKNELEIREKYFKKYCEMGYYSESSNRDKVMNSSMVLVAFNFYQFVKNEVEFDLGYDLMCAFFIVDDYFDGVEDHYKSKLLQDRLYSIINNNGIISTSFDQQLAQHEKFLSKYIKDSYHYSKDSSSKRLLYYKIVQGWLQYIESLHPYNLLQNVKDQQLSSKEIQMFIRRFNIAYFPASDLGVMIEIDDQFEFPYIVYHPKYYLMHSTCCISMGYINDLQSFEKELLENQCENNYLYKIIRFNKINSNHHNNSNNITSSFENGNRIGTIMDSLDSGIKQIFQEIKETNEYAVKMEEEILDEFKSKLNETQFNKLKGILTAGLVINGGNMVWGLSSGRYTTKNSIFIELKQNFNENNTNHNDVNPLSTLINN